MTERKDDDKSNVKDLAAERQKRQPKEKPEKMPPVRVYQVLCSVLNQDGDHDGMPELDTSYHLIEPSPGAKIVLLESPDRTVYEVSDSSVVNKILAYTKEALFHLHDFQLTHRSGVECMRYWKSTTPAIEPPKAVLWKDQDGLAFSRLPWEYGPGDCPTWQKLLAVEEGDKDQDDIEKEGDDREAFMAWVGALFFQKAYRQQYVWIYGPGGNGKGAIVRFLFQVFGRACQVVNQVPKEPNQFWSYQFLNKRLGIFPDCENYHFPASGLFKSMSGEDPQYMEKKHGEAFTATIDTMFLFTSNQIPNLSSEHADMRRPIFMKLDKVGNYEPDFEQRLWAEGGAFLFDCIELYKNLSPDYGPIPVHNESLKTWVSELEEPYSTFFDEWLVLDPESFVNPIVLQQAMQLKWPHKRSPQLEFLKWLERTHKIRRKRMRLTSQSWAHQYQGIRMRKAPCGSLPKYGYGEDRN